MHDLICPICSENPIFNVFFQCEFASLRVTDSASNADENGPFSDPQVIERAELVLPSQRADTYPAR